MEWNGMEWNGMEWNGMEWNKKVLVHTHTIIYLTLLFLLVVICV